MSKINTAEQKMYDRIAYVLSEFEYSRGVEITSSSTYRNNDVIICFKPTDMFSIVAIKALIAEFTDLAITKTGELQVSG